MGGFDIIAGMNRERTIITQIMQVVERIPICDILMQNINKSDLSS